MRGGEWSPGAGVKGSLIRRRSRNRKSGNPERSRQGVKARVKGQGASGGTTDARFGTVSFWWPAPMKKQ